METGFENERSASLAGAMRGAVLRVLDGFGQVGTASRKVKPIRLRNFWLSWSIIQLEYPLQQASTPSEGQLDFDSLGHGCCWETCYMFAWRGLVEIPHITAKIDLFLLPFQRQPRGESKDEKEKKHAS